MIKGEVMKAGIKGRFGKILQKKRALSGPI
jgi:hypothetical protein